MAKRTPTPFPRRTGPATVGPVTPRNRPAADTGDPAPAPAKTTPAGAPASMNAVFHPHYLARVRLFDFLSNTYKGGVGYKLTMDAAGKPILIEHEQELNSLPDYAANADPGATGQFVFSMPNQNAPKRPQALIPGARYARRLRIAQFENHFRPIVDKVSAYVTTAPPRRDQAVSKEAERLDLDEFISRMLRNGLKLTEAWIGYDTARADPDEKLTVADAKRIDPANGLKPFLCEMDPRLVVDWDIDAEDGTVERVVFMERECSKAGFTSAETETVFFKEWTDTEWIVYQVVAEKDGRAAPIASIPIDRVTVTEVGRGQHGFGRCPWSRFCPPFPAEDLAEMNRAIFNLSSLQDEELYNSTFTQKYVVGASVEEVQNATTGTGNTMIITNPEAGVGTMGAVAGQAASIGERIQSLRDAIYTMVNMDAGATKNVAESAAKKKRDLEALYTMLKGIVIEVERVENDLLTGMEILQSKDDPKRTRYDQQFDVFTVDDLLDQAERMGKIPFVPASVRRDITKRLVLKHDPYSDAKKLAEEINLIPDVSPGMTDALATLKREGLLTAEMFSTVTGMPESMIHDVEELFEDAHPADSTNQIDPNTGLPIDPLNPTDPEELDAMDQPAGGNPPGKPDKKPKPGAKPFSAKAGKKPGGSGAA